MTQQLVAVQRGALAEVAKAQAMVMAARVELKRALTSNDLPRALKIKATERSKAIGEAMARLAKTFEQGNALALDAADLIYDSDKGRAILEKEDRATRKRGGDQSRSRATLPVPKAQLKNESRRSPLADVPPEIEEGVRAGLRKHNKPMSSAAVAGFVKLAKKDPELAREALATLGDIGEVRAALGSASRKIRVKEIKTHETPSIGTLSKFAVLYADPPWKYEHVKTESRAIENKYPTMTLEEICALKVADACTPDAILFMWATSPKLGEAFEVLKAWGFTYRTCMVWVKEKIGMGYYARQRHELLLVATRGNPPVPEPPNRPDSVVEEPHPKDADGKEIHSAKPSKFAELVERMYPEFAKLELFCRSPRAGWKAWGNQA